MKKQSAKSKIDELTPKQEKQLEEFREKWLKIGLATGPCDIEKIKEPIEEEYKEIGEEVKYFWRCESPLTAQLIINLLGEKHNLWNNLGANLWDNLRDKLDDNLGNKLWDNLWFKLINNLRDNLKDKLGDNLWDNLRANLGNNFRANLINNLWFDLRDNLKKSNIKYIPTIFWGSLDSYWIAWYLFPHKYLRKIHSKKEMTRLNRYITIAKNCFWWYPFKNICFVCDRPNKISKDQQGRLHCEDGPAISFSDGWQLYFWHGVEVSKKLIEGKITKKDIIKEENAEVRRAMRERLGSNKFAQLLGLKEIDKDTTKGQTVILYRTKSKDKLTQEYLYFVKVSDPSTNRKYFLCVPPDRTKNCYDALSWTFEKKENEYQPLIET